MKLLGKVGIVSAMTAISRFFGLIREVIMANFFGTGAFQSAFVIAFRIPNLFRRLFGEGALGAAFVPVFHEIEQREGKERAQLFLGRILGLMTCVLGLLVAVGIALSYGFEYWWCEEGSRWITAMPLMRIMLPYALLICIAAILSAVLNIHDRFAISSLTPVILNLVWIGTLVLVCPFLPAEGMWRIGAVSFGILLAGIAQIFFQLPELKRIGFRCRLIFTGWYESPYVRQVLLQMGPASLGIALAQINICMDGWLAFYGAEWAPSALEYADRIIYLPLGLFGTAFATVLLPTYTKQYVEGQMDELLATFESALKNIFIIMAPMALGLCVLATPTVSVIYERGAFDQDSVLWTSRAVLAYAPGLLAFSAAKTVIPVFYAQKDLRTPVKVASWCILGNFTLNLLSVLFLPEGWRHVGIAVSTVVNSIVNTVILLVILARRGLKVRLGGLTLTFIRSLLAAGIMALAVVAVYTCLLTFLPLWMALFASIAVGGVVYFPAIACLARKDFEAFMNDFTLLKRLRQKLLRR